MSTVKDDEIKSEILEVQNIEEKNKLLQERLELLKTKIKTQTKKEIRTGTYIEQIYTVGEEVIDKRISKLEKNPEKISLWKFDKMEMFCYPFSSTDKIYIRIGKDIQAFNKYDIGTTGRFMELNNIIKWISNGGIELSLKGKSKSKYAEIIRETHKKAYETMVEKSEKEKQDKHNEHENKMSVRFPDRLEGESLPEYLKRTYKQPFASCPKCGSNERRWFGIIDGKSTRYCVHVIKENDKGEPLEYCYSVFDEETGEYIGQYPELREIKEKEYSKSYHEIIEEDENDNL